MSETNVQLSTSGREPFFTWLGHSPVGLVGLGLTGVGVGVGIGFGLGASRADDNATSVASAIQDEIPRELNDPAVRARRTPEGNYAVCADPALPRFERACSVLKDDIDKRDTDKIIAAVGFATAGVGFATIVVGYLVTSKTSASKASAPPSKDVAQTPRIMVVPVLDPHESGLHIVGRF
jgi:hypothetical protein